ncbi:MAG: nitroreductase family protein [Chloroflexota bacterium]|nr:nitroreductase family protein [Chloroflexota bacterium]
MTEYQSNSEVMFWQLIKGRRTVRRYADRPVPGEIVWRLLEAAHWAPSAHNRQPWQFVWLRSSENRQRLAMAMSKRWRSELLADGADPEDVSRREAISEARIVNAPVVILPCLVLDVMDDYSDERRRQAEWQMGVQSVALACQNLLLAAHHYDLVGCWMCAPIFVPDLVQQILDLPETWQPQALLTIGYPPDDRVRHKPRDPLSDHVLMR